MSAKKYNTGEAAKRKCEETAAAPGDPFRVLYQREMAFELAFVRSGGTLLAGSDPTGNGCVIAGDGLQRQVELLVAAGFTPLEAIRIATLNGATFLGRDARVGSIASGKQADLVVIDGDPSRTCGPLPMNRSITEKLV